MNFRYLFFVVIACTGCAPANAQYNNMWIPDTLAGTHFNLTLRDTMTQMIPGQQTITAGVNGNFWGPTLIFQQGDTVHMNITNSLNDSTTVHWHGFHLPAVMDGGPHQIIPPGAVWQPYWKITNKAATYWYHPHLHEMTMDQITSGLGGLIIVRDEEESSLNLPRTYGVDDIPLVLTDRSFNTANQFSVVPYGDSMVTNGTLRAQYNVPAQVVRFRILDAAIERSYNLGFSDNRTFYVVTSDGGLLNAPVAVTRFLISAGERVEILVDLSNASGSSLDLKAYNSTLANNVPGGENFPNGPFKNFLGKKDFNVLHLNVGTATGNPVTTIPAALTNNVLLQAADADITRTITAIDSQGGAAFLGGIAFVLEHKIFQLSRISHTIPLNNTEIWELTSTSNFGHPFHIHDVQFNVLSINGVAPPAYQAGWKDVIFWPARSTVRFIAKFDDYADETHPFMYHCHIALHEDEGMMGQFVVTSSTSVDPLTREGFQFSVYPNPTGERLTLLIEDPEIEVYYVTVTTPLGRTVLMLPQPQAESSLDVSSLPAGTYFITLMDKASKAISTRKFIKI